MARSKSNKIRLKWIRGAMFVASMLIMIIMVTYSWFISSKKATVEGISIDVSKIPELLINGEKALTLEFDREYPLKSLTGNGEFLYAADIGFPEDAHEQEVAQREVLGYIPIPDLSAADAYKEAGAFAYDFRLSVDNESIDVFLCGADDDDEGSWVIPAPIEHYEDGSNTGPYGDFDVGYITGAIRVAFLQKGADGKYHTTLVWIPDTTTQLIEEERDSVTLITDPESSEIESSYFFLGATDEDKIEVKTNGNSSGAEVIDGVTYVWGELDARQRIGTVTAGTDNDFRLVVWVEGTDRECHNALLDGLICLNLKLGT